MDQHFSPNPQQTPREISLPDVARTTPMSMHEVEGVIQDFIQKQPKNTKIQFMHESFNGNANIQEFSLRKRVKYARGEDPTVVIQGYLYGVDDQKTKIIGTADIAIDFWISGVAITAAMFTVGLILISTQEILIVIVALCFMAAVCFTAIIRPFLSRQQYINTFVNEIKHILPNEDGTFE